MLKRPRIRGTTQKLRVAAYAVCIRNDQILLARWVGPNGKQWTLPGGGIDHGEDPSDAAVREVAEETGYTITVERLLGLDTVRRHYARRSGREVDVHGLRVIYAGRVVGGELRHEIGGSTDQAAWVGLDEVGNLERVDLIDIGLRLGRARPALGRNGAAD